MGHWWAKSVSYTLGNSVLSIEMGCYNGVMHEQCGGRESGDRC